MSKPLEASPESGTSPASFLAGLGANLRPLLLSVPVLTLLTGVAFPLVLAVPARLIFPYQADGSLVAEGSQLVGSEIIAQDFSRPGYFHPRPSAAGDGFDPLASGGSNLGPGNPQLREAVRARVERYRQVNGVPADTPIPIDAVTTSGSGLDPHISPANALLQVPRVARERRLSEEAVRRLVAEHTRGPQLGFLGQSRVAVLALNLALDREPATLTSAP